MMRYKCCLFDFDYTLADATDGIVASMNHALLTMNFPLPSREAIRHTVGLPLSEAFTVLTKNEDPELKASFIRLFKEKADEVMTQNTRLFQDTVPVLNVLKSKGMKTGIVTTKYRYRIVDILQEYQVSHLLDIIVGGDDVKNAKPDPEALLKALDQLAVAKDSVIYIGDNIVDAKAANSANVDFIAVTTGTTAKDDFMQIPHIAIVSTLADILPPILGR